MSIDSKAIIHKTAKIGTDVVVGPFSIIGEGSQLEDRCVVDAHVVIGPDTHIGPESRIHSWAAVGTDSQDKKFKGEKVYAKIGTRTIIREFVTVNRGTGEGTTTIVGDDCLLMAYSHVAHNCIVGNHVVIANVGTLAGYVEIQDGAIVGGLVAIHQFCRVGKLAIIGGCSKVVQDVLPYSMTDGHPAVVRGLNKIGLDRMGVSKEVKRVLHQAFRIIVRSGLKMPSVIEKINEECPKIPEISHLVEFIQSSERGIGR